MNAPARLAAFAAVLALAFGASIGVGRAVGPVGSSAPEHGEAVDHDAMGGAAVGPGTAATAAPSRPGVAGTSASQDGYLLQLATPVVRAATPTRFGFAILGPDGAYLRDYEVDHDTELHLIVARRDLTGFQHVHPERDARGRWFVPLTLPEPGAYKVFADFVPGGAEDGLVLAADVTVPGSSTPAPAGAPADTATVDDYTVTFGGTLTAGTDSPVTLSVVKDGRPVQDLQPYLGAYGHLVALRRSDLAYLHVHPTDRQGNAVSFVAEVPTAGAYGLFLDFKHNDTVRTATFPVEAS